MKNNRRRKTNGPPVSDTRFVAYYRVSTDGQGKSGLGLDSQRETVKRHVAGKDGEIAAEFTETESGTINNRPQLTAALAKCKETGSTLLIAKLDRLARNVHFVSGLLESGVKFVACDNPHADRTMMQVLAVFGEHEARLISERTKAALRQAKRRGVKLGSPTPRNGALVAGKISRDKAEASAKKLLPLVKPMRKKGMTLEQIAEELTRLGIATALGGEWRANSVRNLLLRAK